MRKLASPLSLIVAAVLGGLVSQGISRWMPEAKAQDAKIQDEIRARKIIVVDSEGRTRIELSTQKVDLKDVSETIANVTVSSGKLAGPKVQLTALGGMASVSIKDGLESLADMTGRDKASTLMLGRHDIFNAAAIALATDGAETSRVEIRDGKKNLRAVLGVVDTEVSKTGETTRTAPSSLTLFGKDGKVLWQAP